MGNETEGNVETPANIGVDRDHHLYSGLIYIYILICICNITGHGDSFRLLRHSRFCLFLFIVGFCDSITIGFLRSLGECIRVSMWAERGLKSMSHICSWYACNLEPLMDPENGTLTRLAHCYAGEPRKFSGRAVCIDSLGVLEGLKSGVDDQAGMCLSLITRYMFLSRQFKLEQGLPVAPKFYPQMPKAHQSYPLIPGSHQ